MTLTNIQMIELFEFLKMPIAGEIKMDLRTRLVLKKNMRIISEVVQDVLAVNPSGSADPLVAEYDQEILTFALPFALRGEDGEPIVPSVGSLKIESKHLDKVTTFKDELRNSDKYREVLEKHEKDVKDWQELLNAPYNQAIELLSPDSISTDVQLTSAQWSAFELMIDTGE